ncbi:Ras-related protein Rab-3C [Galemys pyrenaicus]|uniref:small monomeric GTPase n=1 Tax=Galemys pyrenaicus TaxID=202257 RepID=A0A8J6AS85_GALPY|nr:Ras-related protein Rab-3C [Galemys pyrenaicus]
MLLQPGFFPYKEFTVSFRSTPASVLKSSQDGFVFNVRAVAKLAGTAITLPLPSARSTQIKTYSWDNAQVILVGNKCDMEDERVISTERGQHLGEQLGFEFFETSAKDNINVKQTFERLVDIICDKMSESLETDPALTAAKQNTRLKETPPPPQPTCGC